VYTFNSDFLIKFSPWW